MSKKRATAVVRIGSLFEHVVRTFRIEPIVDRRGGAATNFATNIDRDW